MITEGKGTKLKMLPLNINWKNNFLLINNLFL